MAHDRLDALPGIACPTQVVAAADDAITPVYHSRTIAGAVPGARLIVLPDGGHYAVRTRPDFYRGAVLPFLTGMSGPFYLASALVLDALFLRHAWLLRRSHAEGLPMRAFRFSINYLALLFAALLADHYLPRLAG